MLCPSENRKSWRSLSNLSAFWVRLGKVAGADSLRSVRADSNIISRRLQERDRESVRVCVYTCVCARTQGRGGVRHPMALPALGNNPLILPRRAGDSR